MLLSKYMNEGEIKMNVAVVGSRKFDNYKLLESVLNQYNITEIISGGARGADTLAEKYAKLNLIPIKIFQPDWKKYGRRAGIVRNVDIIKSANLVIAFWDGKSNGTKNSINICFKNNIAVKIIKFGDEDANIQKLF